MSTSILRNYGRTYEDESTLFIPPTASLAISGIRRSAFRETYRNGSPSKIRDYEILGTPTAASAELPAVFGIYQDNWSSDKRVTFNNEQIHKGARAYQEAADRPDVQRAVQAILTDLGYGTSEQFDQIAVPLGGFRETHGIQWPPRPSHLSQFLSSTPVEF